MEACVQKAWHSARCSYKLTSLGEYFIVISEQMISKLLAFVGLFALVSRVFRSR